MKKSHLIGAVCALSLVVQADAALAAIVNPLTGLNIGGTLYDVTFHDASGDSFNALWDANDDGVFGGGGSVFSVAPTFWGDASGAVVAGLAIVAALGTVDTTTSGGSDSFLIPFGANNSSSISPGVDVIDAGFDIDSSTSDDLFLLQAELLPDYSSATPTFPYASFAVTPVPLPAPVWLFGSGLLGLIGVARRKKS